MISNIFRSCLACAAVLSGPLSLQAQQVGLIRIQGPIGPATVTYLSRAVDVAAARQDECLIIEMDTPGGLLDSTHEIVEKLFVDAVPTVVYVAPSGADAASAGTFITLAANVAAMAPNTTLGAAHPVSLMSGGFGGDAGGDSVMRQKMENFSASSIAAIAEKRKHNVEWAKDSVRISASLTAEEAVASNVVDLIAKDVPDLLKQLNGRQVEGRTLHTAGATVKQIPMALREKVFGMLWRPEVLYVLMLIVLYGIIGELSSPGAILPGVAGAIALILALYMAAVLRIHVAGLVLVAVAVALFITDVYAPSHGVLTAGGIIAFFAGSLMLFGGTPGFGLSLKFVLPGTVLTALFFIYVAGAGLRAQLRPAQTGPEAMPGKIVTAMTAIDATGGKAQFEGEYWNAVSDQPIARGSPAEVVGLRGLTLHVRPKIVIFNNQPQK